MQAIKARGVYIAEALYTCAWMHAHLQWWEMDWHAKCTECYIWISECGFCSNIPSTPISKFLAMPLVDRWPDHYFVNHIQLLGKHLWNASWLSRWDLEDVFLLGTSTVEIMTARWYIAEGCGWQETMNLYTLPEIKGCDWAHATVLHVDRRAQQNASTLSIYREEGRGMVWGKEVSVRCVVDLQCTNNNLATYMYTI